MKALFTFCSILLISFKAWAQCYSVAQSVYYPDTTMLTTQAQPQISDDQWSQKIPVGFTFCFYGAQYDSLLIGSNGILSFNTSQAGTICMWSIPAVTLPSATVPINSIMGTFCDLYYLQSLPGEIFCWTSGVAPNRTFTVKYDSVMMYSCTSLLYSGRIILHETSNQIEIQIDSKPPCPSWNSGRGIVGIQNQNASAALTAPMRAPMTGSWSASQEAWLFTPTCNVCAGVGIAEMPVGDHINIYPNPSSGAITIDVTNAASPVHRVDVVDVSGRVIETKTFAQNTYQLQLEIETSGTYFLQLMNEAGEIISTEKLVVE